MGKSRRKTGGRETNMRFTKMEGCGNDYIYVDITERPLRDPAAFAVKYSDRHFGIGSDGLITIGRSENADFFMRIYNADGSEGTMCGNGIRCVAKYVYDKGLTDRDEISVETLGGIKVIRMNIEDGKAVSARVDMGVPSLRAADVPVVFPGPDGKPLSEVKAEPVRIAGRDWEMTCVSVGNPHAVVWCEDPEALDLEKTGPLFDHHEMFPERVNTEFIRVIDRGNIQMRVWERGSGETIACGTGATASAYACMVNGKCDEAVRVFLRGGELLIEYDRETGHLFMTGPAKTVFEGECVWE